MKSDPEDFLFSISLQLMYLSIEGSVYSSTNLFLMILKSYYLLNFYVITPQMHNMGQKWPALISYCNSCVLKKTLHFMQKCTNYLLIILYWTDTNLFSVTCMHDKFASFKRISIPHGSFDLHYSLVELYRNGEKKLYY